MLNSRGKLSITTWTPTLVCEIWPTLILPLDSVFWPTLTPLSKDCDSDICKNIYSVNSNSDSSFSIKTFICDLMSTY